MGDMAEYYRDNYAHVYMECDDMGSVEDWEEVTSKVCRYCGAKKLHWRKHNKGWRLFNEEGKLHSCLASNSSVNS